MPDQKSPQVFIQTTVGSNAKLSHSSLSTEYILKVFTGLLWSPEPLCTMAVRALAGFKAEALPYLIEACGSTDLAPAVYEEVVAALVRLERAAVSEIPELLRLVESGHPSKALLLVALVKIAPGDERVVSQLSSALSNTCDTTVAALNKIASYKALELLRRVNVRQPDIDEESLIQRLVSQSIEEKSAAVDQVFKRLPAGAAFFVEPLLDIVEEDGFPELQDKAARVLGHILPCLPDALTTWFEQLMVPDSRISRALSCDDAARPLFEWVANMLASAEASSQVCYIGARILRNFGRRGVPYLIEGMSSSSGHRQFILARELGLMGPDAIDALPELLRITHHSRSFPWLGQRSAILDALARIAPDDARVLMCLQQIASNRSDAWHNAAVAALNDIRSETTSTLSLSDASKFLGTYKGKLRIASGLVDVETRLYLSKTDPAKLCGDYSINLFNDMEYGEIMHRGGDGHRLIFEWNDGGGSGLLETVFNNEFTEFEGVYGDRLSWSGGRCQ